MGISPFVDRFGIGSPYTGSALIGGVVVSNTKQSASPPNIGRYSTGFQDLVSRSIHTGSNKTNTLTIDQYRQGVSLRSPSDMSRKLTPVIGTRRMPSTVSEKINFQMEKNHFGQPKLFRDIREEDGTLMPFVDVPGVYSASILIRSEWTPGISLAYPIVGRWAAILNEQNFLLPDQMDGVIEPLDIRRTIANASIDSPFVAHRIRGSLMTGNWLDDDKGAEAIADVIPVRDSPRIDFYDDAQETIFGNVTFKWTEYGKKGGASSEMSGKGLAQPGWISEINYKLAPFDDSVNYLEGSYGMLNNNYDGNRGLPFISGSIMGPTGSLTTTSSVGSISAVGSRYVTPSRGFIYGIATMFGYTDSIAFGGFKK